LRPPFGDARYATWARSRYGVGRPGHGPVVPRECTYHRRSVRRTGDLGVPVDIDGRCPGRATWACNGSRHGGVLRRFGRGHSDWPGVGGDGPVDHSVLLHRRTLVVGGAGRSDPAAPNEGAPAVP